MAGAIVTVWARFSTGKPTAGSITAIYRYGEGYAPPATWDELEEMAATIQDGERADGNDEFRGFVWQGNAYILLTAFNIIDSATMEKEAVDTGQLSSAILPALVVLLIGFVLWIWLNNNIDSLFALNFTATNPSAQTVPVALAQFQVSFPGKNALRRSWR